MVAKGRRAQNARLSPIMSSSANRPLSAQEKRQYERVVLDLNSIFPAIDLKTLARYVRQSEGSFDKALNLVLSAQQTQDFPSQPSHSNTTSASNNVSSSSNSAPPSSIHSHFPQVDQSEDHSPDIPDSVPSDFDQLKSKYGKHLSSIFSVVGRESFTDYQVLKVLEKVKGDPQDAILELLSEPADLRVERSSLSSSKNALRMSASHITSSSTLKKSSGIEELPLNVNLKALDDTPSSSNSTSTLFSNPILQSSIESQTSDNTNSDDNIDDDGETSDIEDESEFWLVDPTAENEEKRYTPITGVDLFTKMLQEEFDEMLCYELAKQSSVPSNSVFSIEEAYKAQEKALVETKKRSSRPSYYQPFRVPAPVPVPKPSPSIPKVLPKGKEKLIEEDFDKAEFEKFVSKAKQAPAPRKGENLEQVVARADESISLGSTIKSLRQLLDARMAAKNSKPKKRPTMRHQVQELTSDESSSKPTSSTETDPSQVEDTLDAAPTDIAEYISTILKNAIPLTTESCIKSQMQELKELEHVLSHNRLHISESVPKIIAISIEDPSFEITRPTGISSSQNDQLSTTISFRNPLHLQLVFLIPALYPEMAPTILVRSLSPSCAINQEQLSRLEGFLRLTADKHRPTPSLFALVQDAEEWLNTDIQIKKLAMQDWAKANTHSDELGIDANLFGSLKLLFDFEKDYSILKVQDILNQKDKLLKRAIHLFVHGPDVINPMTPGDPDKKFPVYLASGDLDEDESLRAIGLTPGAVRVVLQKYNWNLGALSKAYMASLATGRFDVFLSEAGVAPLVDRYSMEYHLPKVLMDTVECPTCMSPFPFHQMFGLVCGHVLCRSCYTEYVEYAIISRSGNVSSITCPSPGCKYIVDQVSLSGLLSVERFRQYIDMSISQFVQANPSLKWCPSVKGCECIIQLGDIDQDGISTALEGFGNEGAFPHLQLNPVNPPLVVQCKCSYTFCSSCSRIGGHFPATCTECDHWDKEHPGEEIKRDTQMDELLSIQFVKTHSKPCPECGAAISKNGGCMHMICKMCRYEFCWACLDKWRSSHYACVEKRDPFEPDYNSATPKSKTFDQLLARHRQTSYLAAVTKLRHKLIAALYREEKVNNTHKRTHLPSNLEKLITIEDVEPFIEALETMHMSHYIITNACKAGGTLSAQEISTQVKGVSLLSLLNRALQDMAFLTLVFQTEVIKKECLYHLRAGVGPLKTTMKLIISHLEAVRLNHLASLVAQ